MLKYSARTMRRLGINIYKNNRAPGLPPAPAADNWLQSFSFTQGDVLRPRMVPGTRSCCPAPGILRHIQACCPDELSRFPLYLGEEALARAPGVSPVQASPCHAGVGPSSRAPYAFFQLGQESEASICLLAPGLPRQIPVGCRRLDVSPRSILCSFSSEV